MKIQVSKRLQLILLAVVLAGCIGFVEKKQQDRVCKRVIVTIAPNEGQDFLNEKDVLRLMTQHGEQSVVGRELGNIELKGMEQMLHDNKYIKKARVYYELDGTLHIDLRLRKMLARIIRDGGADAYLSADGSLVPVSSGHRAYVMLITGKYADNLIEESTDHSASYFELVRYISQDPFWRSQISQLEIRKDGFITMYPQITRQLIEFGYPEDIPDKFSRLLTFYKKILPGKGWNTYDRVNVVFNNQIICE